jgi:hypothetical protein
MACHPGVASTDLARYIPGGGVIFSLIGMILNTAARGAWPTLQAATDSAAVSGTYWGPQSMGEMRGVSGPASRKPQAIDADVARRLWDVSVELTGVDPGLAPAL